MLTLIQGTFGASVKVTTLAGGGGRLGGGGRAGRSLPAGSGSSP